MKTIGYTCPFVPMEWISAHRLRPVRFIPRSSEDASSLGATTGMCPFAKASANHFLGANGLHGVVMTTTCDQMRRACEVVEAEIETPVFLMHVPTTWQTESSKDLYRSELERLGHFLVVLGGEAPESSFLAETMRQTDSARARLRSTRNRLTPRGFSEAIARFHETGRFEAPSSFGRSKNRGISLALLGGPLTIGHFDLFDLIEKSGGSITLDATTTGERTLSSPFEAERVEGDPLSSLVDAYFGAIPCAFRRPNDELYRWLGEFLPKRKVRGIVFLRYLWCDTWGAELERLREWTDLPVLAIDIGDEERPTPRTASRIDSFLEVLR